MIQFCYVGITYKNAGLTIRDQVSFTDQKKMEFFAKAEELGIRQCLILSTCNRSEVFYFIPENSAIAGQKRQEELCILVRKLYLNSFPQAVEGTLECSSQNRDGGAGCGDTLEQYVTQLQGGEALSYFYRIAAGLESLVLGEDQILGQVREAYDFSKALGYTGKELNKVVRDAITCAKKIKTGMRISEKPLSVSYIGIRMLQKLSGISGKRAFVIGSGKTAELAIRYLFYYDAKEVLVCSRTLGHTRKLLEEFPAIRAVPYEDRYRMLAECPMVISATSAAHVVLRKEEAKRYLSGKGLKGGATHQNTANFSKRYFLDLAAPRDVDPEIGRLPGVTLIDLDVLKEQADQNLMERKQLVEQSREWIRQAVSDTEEWLLCCGVDETIESLQLKCEEIVEDTYRYLNRKLALESREQKILKKMLRASLRRLIREPILELKQIDSKEKQQEYQKVIRDLFKMDENE